MQMKIDTMIVGIDVGKETHYAKAIDIRGLNWGGYCASATMQKAMQAWISG